MKFSEFGLGDDWTEKNGIDTSFFNELSDDLKLDLMLQYAPSGKFGGASPEKQRQQQTESIDTSRNNASTPANNQNIVSDFMDALPQDLRTQIGTDNAHNNQSNNNQPQNTSGS
mmetsp:Transcript_7014/g.6237  ORF Transcript_7014/g.6237 Transcript_7014/m.6237 type:complete len:114 (+) Transcript_7014:796-1137(+)